MFGDNISKINRDGEKWIILTRASSTNRNLLKICPARIFRCPIIYSPSFFFRIGSKNAQTGRIT